MLIDKNFQYRCWHLLCSKVFENDLKTSNYRWKRILPWFFYSVTLSRTTIWFISTYSFCFQHLLQVLTLQTLFNMLMLSPILWDLSLNISSNSSPMLVKLTSWHQRSEVFTVFTLSMGCISEEIKYSYSSLQKRARLRCVIYEDYSELNYCHHIY